MTRCGWETLRTFARNDCQLHGKAGAVAVVHSHSRRLDYHPHVHVVMPAAAIDAERRRWRTKARSNKSAGKGRYLFSHKALAKVFRGKLLAAITSAGLTLPPSYPKEWVVDCKHVGNGEKALVYLGRYLYRGVIREQDILACENGQVIFRYRHAKRNRWEYRTLADAQFLALVFAHVLPKGFRRARNFGFLHPNSKRSLTLLHWLFGITVQRAPADEKPRPTRHCRCCGARMRLVLTGIPPRPARSEHVPVRVAAEAALM